LTVTFHSELDARRAVGRNGEVLGGTWMVGVKWADPFHPALTRASPTPTTAALSTSPQKAMTTPQQPSTPRTGGGGAGSIGTPLQLAPASSAFKRLVPSQAAAAASSSGGRDRALAEAAKGGPPAGQGSSGGGYLGKLGELVFGF
jgi:nuclear pore complex protein Nup53